MEIETGNHRFSKKYVDIIIFFFMRKILSFAVGRKGHYVWQYELHQTRRQGR